MADETETRRDQIAQAMMAQEYAALNPTPPDGSTISQTVEGNQQGYIDPGVEGNLTIPVPSTNPDDFIMPDPPWIQKPVLPDPDPTQFLGVDQGNQLAGFFDYSNPYADAGASGMGSYAAPGPYGSNRRANL
jgi:hypothetical protein